jgi:CHAT domain
MDSDLDINQSFGFLDAAWTVKDGNDLLASLRGHLGLAVPSHVIVEGRDEHGTVEGRYLCYLDDLERALAGRPASQTLQVALDLQPRDRVPEVSVDDDVPLPETYVVYDRARILGFRAADVALRGMGRNVGGPPDQVEERSLIAKISSPLRLDSNATLTVSLTEPEEGRRAILIDLPEGSVVNVAVKSGTKMRVVGEPHRVIRVGADDVSVRFKLRATELGRAHVTVIASCEGRPLGSLTLRPVIEQADRGRPDQPLTEIQAVDAASFSPGAAGDPDLAISVVREEGEEGTEYWFLLNSQSERQLNDKWYGPLKFELNPEIYCRKLFVDIENLADEYPDDDEYEAQLQDLGGYLFELLFPEELRTALLDVHNRVNTLVILSDEPWIPWELCRLFGEDGEGNIISGKFLCEEFAMSRWLPDTLYQTDLPLSKMACVVPKRSGLPQAKLEGAWLMRQGGANRTVKAIDPATPAGVRQGIVEGYDGWHFSGHGASSGVDADDAAIVLEKKMRFRASSISGEAALRIRRAKPMVFLNACETIPGGSSLTGIGGWGNRFVKAQASAFIGTYWSIGDESAREFAEEFYTALLQGTTIAEAVRTARINLHQKEVGSTWLAYTLMAHPSASVPEQSRSAVRP